MDAHELTEATAEGRPFQWFGGKAFDRICEEAAETRGKPNAHMRVYEHGEHRIIRFVADGYAGPPVNESHLCPIDCP